MSNTFGRLLNMYRRNRQNAIDEARRNLEQRNGVNYKNNQAFRIEEQELPMPNGTNVTEIRLWKLVDAAVVTIDPDVEATTKEGITALGDFHADPTHPLYIDPASLQQSGIQDDPTPETKVEEPPPPTEDEEW